VEIETTQKGYIPGDALPGSEMSGKPGAAGGKPSRRVSLLSPALVVVGFLFILYGTYHLLSAASDELFPILLSLGGLIGLGAMLTVWCAFATGRRADDEADALLAELTRKEAEAGGPKQKDGKGWESP